MKEKIKNNHHYLIATLLVIMMFFADIFRDKDLFDACKECVLVELDKVSE